MSDIIRREALEVGDTFGLGIPIDPTVEPPLARLEEAQAAAYGLQPDREQLLGSALEGAALYNLVIVGINTVRNIQIRRTLNTIP